MSQTTPETMSGAPAAALPETIDSHHHLWPEVAIPGQSWQPPGESVLRRAFEPVDLRPELRAAGVTATVLMQSVDGPEENERLLAYAAEDVVRGVVAWAPLDRPEQAAEVVDGLTVRAGGRAPVVGIRCLIGTDPIDWALTAAGLDVFRRLADARLAWDVVPVTAQQRDVVARVADAVPDLRVVVDHLGSPPAGPEGREGWIAGLRRLAGCPGIAVKLSVGVAVLTAVDHWSTPQLASWVSDALGVFGPHRSMVASNWPVVLLRASYARAWQDVVEAATAALPDATADPGLAAVLGGTARDWYGLSGAGA